MDELVLHRNSDTGDYQWHYGDKESGVLELFGGRWVAGTDDVIAICAKQTLAEAITEIVIYCESRFPATCRHCGALDHWRGECRLG